MASIAAPVGKRARGNRMIIIAAAACGLLTAFLLVSYLSKQAREQRILQDASVDVVVAKKDIPLGTEITSAMVEHKRVTPDVAAASAFAETEMVIGLRARMVIPAGAQVVPGMLVQAGSSDALSYIVPPGKRAMSITGNDVIGGGGHIRPGDFVDVLVVVEATKLMASGTPTPGDEKPKGVYTILQNIEVLAMAEEAEKIAAAGPEEKNKGAKRSSTKTVTLAVDPYQAQLLFLAESEGKVRLALRPFGEQDERQLPAVVEPLAAPSGGARPAASR